MADDRAVHHHEERLGDEGAEGGNGEGDDLAIVPSGACPGYRGSLCHALNLIFHR